MVHTGQSRQEPESRPPGYPPACSARRLHTMRARLIADRYRLEEHLGAGAMGEVWLATDQELGRRVALKRSQQHDNGRIRREARIGAGLQHPYVITVFDAITDDDGHRWLVMEYLPSRSLAEILETDGALPPEQVAKIGVQLADAMAAMHARGMVHRDIKPGNVLVADDGTAKLTDLGIAQWTEVTLTGSAQIGGTPGYLAPEVADGRAATPASDVFSLGATLFAAVEGTTPWNGEDGPFAQLRRARAYDLRAPRKAGALAPVLARLMRKEPTARPTAEDAQRLLAGDTRAPKSNWRVRRRMLGVGAGVVALALAAGLIYGISSAGTEPAAVAHPTGDPRTADPCSLLDPAWFSSFGAKAEFDRESHNFNACSVLVNQTADPTDVVDVWLTFEADGDTRLAPPVAGQLVAADLLPTRDGACTRVIKLPENAEVIVGARHRGNGRARLCEMVGEAARNILPILNGGRIPRRAEAIPAESLASADACALLDDKDLDPVAGPVTAKANRGFAGWECQWPRSRGVVHIGFDRERWTPADDDEGRYVRLGGREVHIEAEDNGCRADIVHRWAVTAGRLRRETVQIHLWGDSGLTLGTTTVTDLCAGVRTLAQAAAERLPAV